MKQTILVICLSLIVAAAGPSLAGVVTIELGNENDINPDSYIVEIFQMPVVHSTVELYIENIEDPLRYKEWEIIIYTPDGYDPVTQLDILDYEITGQPVLNIYNVPMESAQNAIPIPGYTAYHASTYEALWYEYGTQPINSGGDRIDIGNPKWISYHFTLDDNIPESTQVFVSIHDECIPEPATIAMLGLGGLFMLRRNKTSAESKAAV